MKWKNHLAIARAIARSMRLPDDLEQILCEGSIEPDRHPDWEYRGRMEGGNGSRRMPHHDPDPRVIVGLVWKARQAHLQGDDENAVWRLGKALHYVQDASVATGFLGWRHEEREEEIGECRPPFQAVMEGLLDSRPSPSFVQGCIDAIRPKEQAEAAMYQACVYSAAIAEAVLGPITPERVFAERLSHSRSRHLRLIVPMSMAVGAAFILGALVLSSVLVALPAVPAAYLVQRLDLDYYFLRNEARWYGM
jgi:hypothetical protein